MSEALARSRLAPRHGFRLANYADAESDVFGFRSRHTRVSAHAARHGLAKEKKRKQNVKEHAEKKSYRSM